ncbi:variable large family protein, partial [Pseudomonas aeruginosa]|nr:variable large family protein [Pseudomonas aeruginosa]
MELRQKLRKADVGKYFTDIAETMETVKKKLNDEVSKNRNYAKIKTVVDATSCLAESIPKSLVIFLLRCCNFLCILCCLNTVSYTHLRAHEVL